MSTKALPLSFRLPPETKAALEKAADDERRSLSNLIDKVLTEWLTAKGYLPK